MTIDGTTQPDYPGTPLVELNGSLAGAGANGLTITAGTTSVKAVVINRFAQDGVNVTGSSATLLIETSYIGTSSAGTIDQGNGRDGIRIVNAKNNQIGDDGLASRNVISGNEGEGIFIQEAFNSTTNGTFIQGNIIGLDRTGAVDVGNTSNGVLLNADVSGVQIGGTTTFAGNVISGNNQGGIQMIDRSSNNAVLGNYIGTDEAGEVDLGNNGSGIALNNTVGNVIGIPGAGDGNVISGNGSGGVSINGTDATVQGNRIGTDDDGNQAIANSVGGIFTFATGTPAAGHKLEIGGTTTGAGNVISGNTGTGVEISGSGSAGAEVQGNIIGLDVTGALDLGNTGTGVVVNGSAAVAIGSREAGARNVISGNEASGVEILGSGASGSTVRGNIVGLDATGEIDRGNTGNGVLVSQVTNVTVGGTGFGARNVISGNDASGIQYFNGAGSGTVQGNYIGTDDDGEADLGNSGTGVALTGAQDMQLGGTTPGAGNLVSGNAVGFSINSGSDGTKIEGNLIGTNAAGTGGIGNSFGGVSSSSSEITIGGTAREAANTIAFNFGSGVRFSTGTNSGLSVLGNSIFGNSELGIDLGGAGVTPNDLAPDADPGPNGLQNFPVVTAAVRGSSTFQVEGLLESERDETYRIELFAGPCDGADPNDYGEGQRFLAAFDVTTNGDGVATFEESVSGAVSAGEVVTATATDSQGSTSEFSECRASTPQSALSVGDVTVDPEGGTASVPVTLATASEGTVRVDFATADGSATAGSDYSETNGTLTFAPGDTAKTIDVPVTADNLDEDDEAFVVDLTNLRNATLNGDARGQATIVDDDAVPSVSIGDVTVPEGDSGQSNASFTVSLSAPSGRQVTASFATANGTASAGSDYTATSGQLTFAPGDATKTVTVAITGDATDEDDETFSVTLSAAQNAAIADAQAQGTITDDDPIPSLAVSDVTVTEGNSGERNAAFTVSLSGPSAKMVTAGFATAGGTTTSGADYDARNGNLTFAPGDTTKTVNVPVNGDTADEPDETFLLSLTGPVNATLADATGQGLIVDDDDAAPDPPPSITRVSITNKRFVVKRPRRSRTPVGTAFRFTLSEAASVRIAIQRKLPGRRVGTRCERPSRSNARRPRCTRLVLLRPRLDSRQAAGARSIRFTGKLGGKALPPGSYRATLVAIDAAGQPSRLVGLNFRIVSR